MKDTTVWCDVKECTAKLNLIWEDYERLKKENNSLKQELEDSKKLIEQLYKLP